MTKALLLSVIAATVVVPAIAARKSRPWSALRMLVWAFALFCAFYVGVVIFGTPGVEG